MERLLIAIIRTGAHLNPKKWREAASSFYSCSQIFIDVFQAYEDKAIRRLKGKVAEEQKRICQTRAGGTTIKAICRPLPEIWVPLKLK